MKKKDFYNILYDVWNNGYNDFPCDWILVIIGGGKLVAVVAWNALNIQVDTVMHKIFTNAVIVKKKIEHLKTMFKPGHQTKTKPTK